MLTILDISDYEARKAAIAKMKGTSGERDLQMAIDALRQAEAALGRLLELHPHECCCEWCEAREAFEDACPEMCRIPANQVEPLATAASVLIDVKMAHEGLTTFVLS